MEKKVEQPDPYRRSKDFNRCAATYESWPYYIPIALLLLFNGGILLFGLYLSIRVRKIPYSLFNETKVLIFSVILADHLFDKLSHNCCFYFVLALQFDVFFHHHYPLSINSNGTQSKIYRISCVFSSWSSFNSPHVAGTKMVFCEEKQSSS